ncbi:MAG: hypothetical protein WAK35_00700, partial [Xanthobacteraceae bacterium]
MSVFVRRGLDLCSHGCAVFLRLTDRAIGFWPSGWCCLADTNADDTNASDFPQNLACGADAEFA